VPSLQIEIVAGVEVEDAFFDTLFAVEDGNCSAKATGT